MYYITHIKFAIQHRCYQLNDQDIACGIRILTEMKGRKNVLQVGKCNHGPFFLQAKTLYCTMSLIYQLSTCTFIVNHSSPGNSEYNVMLSRPVPSFIPLSTSLEKI